MIPGTKFNKISQKTKCELDELLLAKLFKKIEFKCIVHSPADLQAPIALINV